MIGICFQAAGYLSVACFFFLSGYGLYASYQEKGIAYIKNFFKKTIVPFYCIILLFTVIYFGEEFLIGQTLTTEVLLKSFTFGGTVIKNGWYLQVQLLLYLFFFITFLTIKDGKQCIILIISECLLFCFFMYVLGYSSTWYESIFSFATGMIWRELDLHYMKSPSNKTVFFVCALEFILVCFTFVGSYLIDNNIAMLILKMASAVFFVALIETAINLISVENRITRWLGKFSMEIYIVQGIFLTLFHSQLINITNQYIYILVVTVTTIGAAVLFHPVTRKIYSIARGH